MTTARPATKAELRASVLAARAARPQPARDEAGSGLLRQLLSLSRLREAESVAAYVAGPDEPETRPLLCHLRDHGTTVLLPVLRDDFDLDWAEFSTLDELRPGRFGILEPTARRLGVDAIRQPSAVVCPGVAGDLEGRRLGRGGGSYDRVLHRLPPETLRCLLLFDDDVIDTVPTRPHDEPVDVIVTPSRVLATSARGL